MFCKKENLALVQVALNEQDEQLKENLNVIKIKLMLNEKILETTISLKKVKKARASESDKNSPLIKVKEYIEKELHKFDSNFDTFVMLNPDRQFFANQRYNDVVLVINEFVKIFCKKEKLALVQVVLNEQDEQLKENLNVIYVKLMLNEKTLETIISLKNVKKADPNEQKANHLAVAMMKKVHYFTYKDFNELPIFSEVVTKIKQIYQSDISTSYLNRIEFDQNNQQAIIASSKMKWDLNQVPLEIRYNNMVSKINLQVNLIKEEKFAEYEVNRVIDEFLIKNQDSLEINPDINKQDLKLATSYQQVSDKINDFLRSKQTLVTVKLSDGQAQGNIDRSSSTIKIKLDVYLEQYNKSIELLIDEMDNN